MSHLGNRVAALVDGQLPHDVRDRVLAHLAGCPDCRAAADAERDAKEWLAATADPTMSPEFTHKLRALAEPGDPLPPRRDPVGYSTRPPSVPVARAFIAPPAGRPPGRLRRQQRIPRVAAAAVGAAVVAFGAAVLAGGEQQPGPAVGPAGDRFAVEHAATSVGLPLRDPATTMTMTIGFAGTTARTSLGYTAGSGGGSRAGAVGGGVLGLIPSPSASVTDAPSGAVPPR